MAVIIIINGKKYFENRYSLFNEMAVCFAEPTFCLDEICGFGLFMILFEYW